MKRLLFCARGTAAVEAAIFAPIFLLFTVGITDLGAGMFVRMTANTAAQSGAFYAVFKSSCTPQPCTPVCASLTATCLSGIETAMTDAASDPSFCAASVSVPTPCTASIAPCADGSPKCISVTANHPYTPILPDAVYTWGKTQPYSTTVTIRIQ